MDKEIMMEDQISLGRLTATITKIWWERIIVHIDLQLTYADESLKGEKFDVNEYDKSGELRMSADGKLFLLCLPQTGDFGKMCDGA